MQKLIVEIRELEETLAGLRSDNIVIENLASIMDKLKGADIEHKLAEYKRSLPDSPENEKALEKNKEVMKGQADTLNKAADHFLDELNRIKTIRQTLNLEALDPIIREARRIIHSLHGFSAGLQDD